MESRQITILMSSGKRKVVLNTGAETLGELKKELDNKGINYEGMVFFEGVSNTEMKGDNSALPKDILYKGERTNNLAFLLTSANKNIKSGASRPEMYEYIKKNKLQQTVKNLVGKDYTRCSNVDLRKIISDREQNKVTMDQSDPAIHVDLNKKLEDLTAAVSMLVDALECAEILNDDEINYDEVRRLIGSSSDEIEEEVEEKSAFSDNDLDNMFGGLR